VSTYDWLLSGKDAFLHAFPAVGGYREPTEMVSVIPLSKEPDALEETFGPYDVFISACAHVIPVAMLMTESSSSVCRRCQALTGSKPSNRSGPTAPQLRQRLDAPTFSHVEPQMPAYVRQPILGSADDPGL
jgi:hypothetical protein